MRIIDIIPSIKVLKNNTKCYYNTVLSNKLMKYGYFYDFDIISYDKMWVVNNCEKDNVVAYWEEKFTKFMICKKGKNGLKLFTYINNGICGYNRKSYNNFNLCSCDDKDIHNMIEVIGDDNVKVVDEEEYKKWKRKMMMEKLENGK